jgi:C4-type Zn-finger protein
VSTDLICPLCEIGKLEARVEKIEQEYNGHKALLDLHYSECLYCGSEVATTEQLRLNKQSSLDFKRSVS